MNDPKDFTPYRFSTSPEWGLDSPYVYAPIGLERRYAYPAIVMLQSTDQTTRSFHQNMEAISERNYVGISVPVSARLMIDRQKLHHTIKAAIGQTGKFINLHTERITVFGSGELGRLATEVVLQNPAAYSGFITVDTCWNGRPLTLSSFRELRHLRGLILESKPLEKIGNRSVSLLHSAGVDLRVLTERDSSLSYPWRIIDHFLMQGIYKSQLQWS